MNNEKLTKIYERFFLIISKIEANKNSERTFETPCRSSNYC